jgi:hypothetical protein
MKITIESFTLRDFHLAPELQTIFLRVYSLQFFVAQSDSTVIQPGSPTGSPFYQEWECMRDGSDLVIPEITLESTNDALSPPHPEGLRYYAAFFDAGGAWLCDLWPKPIFRLDVYPNPTNWAAIAAYNSAGVQFDWTTEHADHYAKEELHYQIQNPPAPPPVGTFVVTPPLTYDGTTLALPRSSATQDGYLAGADFANFAAPRPPAGVSGDIQYNNGNLLAASVIQQLANQTVSGATATVVSIRSPLTQNVSGTATAAVLRVMDTDDGAGNAQWFQIWPTYGAMNLQWQYSGTGMQSREFFIDNGKCRIVMHGFWRGNVDEGDQIAMFTLDSLATTGQFLNGILIQGEHSTTSFTPGIYIRAHNTAYQYYFNQTDLLLPGDPTTALGAATRQYVDNMAAASTSSGGAAAEYTVNAGAMTGDPGQKKIGFSTNNQYDATSIYVNYKRFDGTDVSSVLREIQAGRILAVQLKTSAAVTQTYTVNSTTDNGTYFTYGVTPTAGTPTGFPIANNQEAMLILQSQIGQYVPLTGATMTGPLILSADPTQNLQAATKNYVDTRPGGGITSIIAGPGLTGGTITTSGQTIALDLASANTWTGGQVWNGGTRLDLNKQLLGTFSTGAWPNLIGLVSDVMYIGASTDKNGASAGYLINFRCGTGAVPSAGTMQLDGINKVFNVNTDLKVDPAHKITTDSLYLWDAALSTYTKVSIGAAGTGPAGSGKALYL